MLENYLPVLIFIVLGVIFGAVPMGLDSCLGHVVLTTKRTLRTNAPSRLSKTLG